MTNAMTDNRTTELRVKRLRELLDERGIEHYDHENGEPLRVLEKAEEPATSWRVDGASYCAVPDGKGTFDIWIDHCTPEQAIAATLGNEINGDTSDGYHTFDELYHHRAVLFSVIVRDHRELAWKAKKHHDGTMYDGMFIVGIETPKGQATYHYDLDPYWEMFDCEEREYAPEWDGHTPDDAIARIAELGSGTCRNISELNKNGVSGYYFTCSECGLSVCASMGIGEIEPSGPRSFGWKVDGRYEFERCPRCGKAVTR